MIFDSVIAGKRDGVKWFIGWEVENLRIARASGGVQIKQEPTLCAADGVTQFGEFLLCLWAEGQGRARGRGKTRSRARCDFRRRN